jgi:hypothetical protein
MTKKKALAKKPTLEKKPSKKMAPKKAVIKDINPETDQKSNKPVKVKGKKKIKQRLFNTVQKELAVYSHEKDIKLGKEFQSHASKIYKKILEEKQKKDFKGNINKFVKDNIEALFKKATDFNIAPKPLVISEYRSFPEKIKFYNISDEFVKPQFQDVTIVWNSFEDDFGGEFPKKEFNSGLEFIDWFERVAKFHFRSHYNSSNNIATLNFINYDEEDNYVEYVIKTGEAFSGVPISPKTGIPTTPTKEAPSSINRINELRGKYEIYQKRKEDLKSDIEFYEKRKKKDLLAEAEEEYFKTDKKIKDLLKEIDSL